MVLLKSHTIKLVIRELILPEQNQESLFLLTLRLGIKWIMKSLLPLTGESCLTVWKAQLCGTFSQASESFPVDEFPEPGLRESTDRWRVSAKAGIPKFFPVPNPNSSNSRISRPHGHCWLAARRGREVPAPPGHASKLQSCLWCVLSLQSQQPSRQLYVLIPGYSDTLPSVIVSSPNQMTLPQGKGHS